MKRKQGVDLVPFQAPIKDDKSNQYGPSGTTTGSLLEYTYARPGEERSGVEWRENTPFQATLYIDGTERGRSAARFIWKTADGRRFPMFLTDTVETLRRGVEAGGSITALWMVAKRGENYGIRLADEVLSNDAAVAHNRDLAADLPTGWYRITTPTATVAHLMDPDLTSRYGDTYPLCFTGRRPESGWVTGEKADRRKTCVKCAVQFNARVKSGRI